MPSIIPQKGPVTALAVLTLVVGTMSAGAAHNEGLLELDGNIVGPENGGCGFDLPPAGGACTDNNISIPATFDWDDVCQPNAITGVIQTNPGMPGPTCLADFVVGSSADLSYHTGSDKDYQEIWDGSTADWGCESLNNAPNKRDLLNAYFVRATISEGGTPHQLVFMGAERRFEHGSAFNGYWILQSGISVPGAVTTAGQLDCTPGAPLDFSGQHVCGDVLVLFNYETGGRIGRVAAYQWQPGLIGCDGQVGTADDCPNPASAETHDPLCLIVDVANGDCRIAGADDNLCGRVNGAPDCAPTRHKPQPCSGPGAFAAPWEPNDGSPPSTVLESPTFSEAGIDLTGLGIEIPCVDTFIAETRSSSSVTASLKDYTLTSGLAHGCRGDSEMRTEIHAAADNSDPDLQGGTVVAGTVVHDVALFAVSSTPFAPNATGTVTFHRYTTIYCSGTPVDEVVTVTDQIPGGIPNNTLAAIRSSDFLTVEGQNLSYMADYSGDANYPALISSCETLAVVT